MPFSGIFNCFFSAKKKGFRIPDPKNVTCHRHPSADEDEPASWVDRGIDPQIIPCHPPVPCCTCWSSRFSPQNNGTAQQKQYKNVHEKNTPPKVSHMGVSKNMGGPRKWMVKIMENPIKMDDLGVPLFLETPVYRPWKLMGLEDHPASFWGSANFQWFPLAVKLPGIYMVQVPRMTNFTDDWIFLPNQKTHWRLCHLSNVQNPVDIPLYWLVNRDPYTGLL